VQVWGGRLVGIIFRSRHFQKETQQSASGLRYDLVMRFQGAFHGLGLAIAISSPLTIRQLSHPNGQESGYPEVINLGDR